MKILVLGGGRISKALCALLANAPCTTDVYARRELQRTFFSMRGHKVTDTLPSLAGYDAIVNTIPADIFHESVVSTANEGTLVVDLSARPGYVPKDMCQKYGLKLCYLPGIPLKSAPRSAGIAAAKAVLRMYR
jgi:shikimate 5-dehydrogenase